MAKLKGNAGTGEMAIKPEIGTITNVTTKDYLAAAATLSDAFEHDDVARYFLDMPDMVKWSDSKKWKLHCNIMNYMTVSFQSTK